MGKSDNAESVGDTMIHYCPICNQMTNTVKGMCGKCKKMHYVELPRLIKTNDYEGYDIKELKKLFTKEQYSQFLNWFAGKTGGIDKGRWIIYKHDFERFMDSIGMCIG